MLVLPEQLLEPSPSFLVIYLCVSLFVCEKSLLEIHHIKVNLLEVSSSGIVSIVSFSTSVMYFLLY